MLRAFSGLLTTRHKVRGVARNCQYCPVAQLLWEVPGIEDIEITEDEAFILVRDGRRTSTRQAALPEAVQA